MQTTNFKLKTAAGPRRKRLLFFVIVVVLLSSGAGTYLLMKNRSAENARIEQKARDEAQTNSAKSALQDTDARGRNLPDDSTEKTTDDIATSETLSLKITETSQSDGIVRASTSITGASADGTCVFTYSTQDERPVIQQVASANGICLSSVSEVQFAKLGSWNLSVIFYISNSKSEVSQNVTIN